MIPVRDVVGLGAASERAVDTAVPIVRVALAEFDLPAPPPEVHAAAVRADARTDPVRGWLVGVSDGDRWGFWGPIHVSVARQVPAVVGAALPLPGTADPAWFGRLLRRATRHAHTGLLAVAVGAVELALWDLAAKRAGLPVWRLLAPAAVAGPMPAYATCFGVRGDAARIAAVMDEVAGTYTVQKWDPAVLGDDLVDVTVDFVRRRGPGRLAVDFHGAWPADRVRAACAPVAGGLAWVEEPYHPDEIDRARPGEFGVAHAAGEHCYGGADTVQLREGRVDVWQPDAVFCGGLVSLLGIVHAARAAGARCAPHGGGLLPALHLAVTGAPIDVLEFHLLLEPRRSLHLAGAPLPGGSDGPGAAPAGTLPVPTAPGWGGDLHADLRLDLVDV
ncbi:enolase C-terminal domain-like protein [Dactylosporangium sp. NPDC051485]|uniref:enolase C-terminal domain-like protein n=1 Tax=Dactylosporangium sp. NPDC051485 TaxID=3154846 RepID=UPI00341E6EDD